MRKFYEPCEHIIDRELASGNINAWRQVLGFPESEQVEEAQTVKLKNKRMEEMLRRGSAIDLSECRMEFDGRWYVIEDKFALNCLKNDIVKDYCISKTEEWIWSIGRLIKDAGDVKAGTVLASTTTSLYQNEHFECLWLR